MFRMWGQIFKENRLVKDTVICCEDLSLNRTRKVYATLDDICVEFDLQTPIWLEKNKKEFIELSKTRFHQDSFIEEIDFDFLEIQVIEEDYQIALLRH